MLGQLIARKWIVDICMEPKKLEDNLKMTQMIYWIYIATLLYDF